MKLKKIASLALAGIMAVSMLAGCKNGESSSSSSSSEATVTTSDSAAFATAMNDGRTDHAKDIVDLTYEADSSLEEILKSIVTDKYGKDSNALETLISKNKFSGASDSKLKSVITSDLAPKIVGGIDATWTKSALPAVGVHKYAYIYTVGGGYTAEEAANFIRNSYIKTLESGDYMLASDAQTPTKTATYGADVAAVKMTSNAHSDLSVWFVAVVYTQTVA